MSFLPWNGIGLELDRVKGKKVFSTKKLYAFQALGNDIELPSEISWNFFSREGWYAERKWRTHQSNKNNFLNKT